MRLRRLLRVSLIAILVCLSGARPAATAAGRAAGKLPASGSPAPPAGSQPVALAGRVTDSRTGWPLYATILLSGPASQLAYTSPADGRYATQVPLSGTYALNIAAPGYVTAAGTITIGAGGATYDAALEVDAQPCAAPGYRRNNATGVLETFDDPQAPAGWTVVDHYGFGHVWRFDNAGRRANQTGGGGNFATADTQATNGSAALATELRSPLLDLRSLSTVLLSFNSDFKWSWTPIGTGTRASMDVSNDNGATWTTVWQRTGASDRGPRAESVDISDLLAGRQFVRLRLSYVSPTGDHWWQVDDLSLGRATCDPIAGQLVYGHVYDQNTGQPVNGATVAISPAYAVAAAATPDPALDDGFYVAFQDVPGRPISASAPGGYGSDTRVAPAQSQPVRQDFALPAGRLTLQPADLALTMTLGMTETRPLLLTNAGSLPVQANPAPAAAWLSAEPLSLTLAPGQSRLVALGVSAVAPAITQPGLYQSALDIADNDPYPALRLPVRLRVDAPPAWGKLRGVVSASGPCDTPLGPLAGVQVQVAARAGGAWNTLTGADGAYERWLDPAAGPFTVTAKLAGYGQTQVGGLTVTAQETTTHALTLRRTLACISAAAQPLTLTLGMTGTAPLTIRNSGASASNINVYLPSSPQLPWLRNASLFRSVPADSAVTHQLSYVTYPYITEPGTYQARLVMEAAYPTMTSVPVTLTVVVPPGWSRLTGTIGGLGACDTPGAGLGLATAIAIDRTGKAFGAPAEAGGGYALWFDPATAPLTVTFSAPGYVAQTIAGVSAGPAETVARDATLRLDAPCVSVSPPALALSQPPETQRTVPLTVSNTGAGMLDLSLFEAGRAGQPRSADILIYVTDPWQGSALKSLLQSLPGVGAIDIIDTRMPTLAELRAHDVVIGFRSPQRDYPDRESLGDLFAEYVDGGGKLLLLAASARLGGRFASEGYGPFLPVSGNHYSRLQLGAYDAGHPLMRGVAAATTVFYEPVVLAPGATQAARWLPEYPFVATKPGVVAVNAAPGIGSSGWSGDIGKILYNSIVYLLDEPWLGGLPAYRSIAPGASASLTLTVDTSRQPADQPGAYASTLIAASGYGPGPHPAIPLTLTVTTPASWAQLRGAATALGQCDSPGAPLANARVVVRAAGGRVWETRTGADGAYQLWLDAAHGPVEARIAVPGYQSWRSADIPLTAGASSVRDAELRRLAPCLAVAPLSINAAATLGLSVTVPLTVANRGAAAADLRVTSSAGWLSALPAATAVITDGAAQIALLLDSSDNTISQSGVYTAALTVSSQAAPGHSFSIPVRFQVNPGPAAGILRGVIRGLGYCNAPLGPLSGASVQITDRLGRSWTHTTGADGAYVRQLDAGAGPFALRVSHPAYPPRLVAQIALTPGADEVRDINLRADQACVQITGAGADWTIPAGGSRTIPLTVSNLGAAAATYRIDAAQPLNVLIVHGSDARAGQLASRLAAFGTLSAADTWDANGVSGRQPALADLDPYSVVVLLGSSFYNSELMGDVLADYVDRGGGVVLANASWSETLYGRIISGGYSPFAGQSRQTARPDATLGAFNAAHPIMDGVMAIFGGFRGYVDLTTNSDLVASWSDQEEMVAVKGRVVAINAWLHDGAAPGNDLTRLLYNALNYLQPVPWLAGTPVSGTLAADSQRPFALTLSAAQPAVAEPGWYSASLVLRDTDARNQVLSRPIRMFVPPPAGWGRLSGQVRALGYCNAAGAPLRLARLTLRGSDGVSRQLIADAAGRYEVYLPPQSHLLLSAAAAGYVDSPPAVVAISSGGATVRDLDLRLPESCVKPQAAALEVFVTSGTSLTHQLLVRNTGGVTGSLRLAERTAAPRQPAPGPYPLAWDTMAPYPSIVMYAAAAELNGKIYVSGGAIGYQGAEGLNTAHVYDPQTNHWAPIASMARIRGGHKLVAAQGRLYAIGGTSPPSIEVYDPAADQWSAGPAYPSGRFIIAAAEIDGQIYIVGGCETYCAAPETYRYDPASGQWAQLAAYPERVNVHDCAAVHAMLYCFNGETNNYRAYRYTPATDRWSPIAAMPQDRRGYLTVANDMLVMVGNSIAGAVGPLYALVYDPLADAWSVRGEWANRRRGAASACGFYWIGGIVNFDTWQTADVSRLRGLYPCGPVNHAPWLAAPQATALLGSDETAPVPVVFDATAPEHRTPGEYTAMLDVVTSDGVGRGQSSLPVKMIVLPAGSGLLRGTVSGVAPCGQQATLAGASVTVRDTRGQSWTAASGHDGAYALALPAWHLPLTVVAARPGFASDQQTYAGPPPGEATVDLALQQRAPCVTITPAGAGRDTLFDARLPWPAAAAYQWDFGDGTGGAGAQVRHAYLRPDTYTVRLTAAAEGESFHYSAQVRVTSEPVTVTRIYLPLIRR